MTTLIILTVVPTILSINAVTFLMAYWRLLNSGVEANGLIVAYEASNFIMTKNVAIPKIKFQTEDKLPIIGKPIYSWFIELNNYHLNRSCVAFYDKKDPNRFIIRSNTELVINSLLVTSTLISLIWLLIVIV